MATNTVSLYLPSPLFERSKQAEADGKFKIRDVCAAALEQALDGTPGPVTAEDNVVAGEPTLDLTDFTDAATLAEQASALEYQFNFSKTLNEAQAFLDLISSQGAWPISHGVDPMTGEISILVAWPKVLTAVEP